MADRYDTITQRRLDWEAIERMAPVDDVFRDHVVRLLRTRGIEPMPEMFEAKAWRPEWKV